MVGRFAETEDPVLFARFGEFDKCEFIKLNAPEEAWASTDDGAGLLVKVDALREQAREALVSAVRFITPCTRSPHLIQLYLHIPGVLDLTTVADTRRNRFWHHTAALATALPNSNRCD